MTFEFIPGPSLMTDMVYILSHRHPKASRTSVERAARATTAVSEAVTKLSPSHQKKLAEHSAELHGLITEIAERLDNKQVRIDLKREGPIEEMKGSGFNPSISYEEGLRRVSDYATPVKLETWAGPVASPSDLEKMYGVKRSTLHDWRKNGAVIGLLRGVRKHVFPLAQFIDGRPVEGIAQVTEVIKQPRTAWLWLTRPHPTEDGIAPIERLKFGRIAEVIDAAENDFGQS
jgi:hypothetical protein